MILQNIKIKSFFLNKNLEIPFLILFISLLFSLLPTSVHAAAGADAVQLTPEIGALAPGNEAIAIGHNAAAAGDQSIAIGTQATTPAVGSIAIGNRASAPNGASLAIGSQVDGVRTTAGQLYGTAVGSAARTDAEGGTALGYNAHAQHQYSVALGAYSTTTADYTVSVGSSQAGQPHQYRRITHVADPVDDHDAATKSYVDHNFHVENQNLNDKIDKVGAMRMSTSNARVRIPEGKTTAVGIGVGSYQQGKATTFAIKQRAPGFLNGLQVSGNFTIATEGDKAGGAGIGYAF